ncbi:hypothetical protein Tco_0964047 [Tanacetum coccineum]
MEMEKITMDFVTKLPRTAAGQDTIWEVSRSMEYRFVILIAMEIYFTFLEVSKKALGTRLDMSTAYHPEIDGQSERTIQITMPKDIPEPAQEGAVEATIIGVESAVIALTKRIAELERDNRRFRGTVSVESQRVDQLQRGMSRMQREKMPSTRSGASMTREEFEELVTRQVAEEMEAREAARTLEPLNENVLGLRKRLGHPMYFHV